MRKLRLREKGPCARLSREIVGILRLLKTVRTSF